MKSTARVIGLTLLVLMLGAPALADQNFTVTADTTIDGHAGTMMFIEDIGYSSQTVFAFDEGGLLRVYASRAAGSDIWEVLPGTQYLVRLAGMSAGMTWRFLDEDDGGETQAEAITLEIVSTGAGNHTAWRVDVSRVSDPSTRTESLWFANGIGLVKSVNYYGQWIDWEETLGSYGATGTGYFPLDSGNHWEYVGGEVPAAKNSVGSVKSRYAN